MSLFGADQVYTCLEKVYMVYTGLPPDARGPSTMPRAEWWRREQGVHGSKNGGWRRDASSGEQGRGVPRKEKAGPENQQGLGD